MIIPAAIHFSRSERTKTIEGHVEGQWFCQKGLTLPQSGIIFICRPNVARHY
jgi:hypothetical protein